MKVELLTKNQVEGIIKDSLREINKKVYRMEERIYLLEEENKTLRFGK